MKKLEDRIGQLDEAYYFDGSDLLEYCDLDLEKTVLDKINKLESNGTNWLIMLDDAACIETFLALK